MSRRCKSRTMRFRVPLSVPGSRYVEHCYGMHGKSYCCCPVEGAEIELVLVNAQRQLWRVAGSTPSTIHNSPLPSPIPKFLIPLLANIGICF